MSFLKKHKNKILQGSLILLISAVVFCIFGLGSKSVSAAGIGDVVQGGILFGVGKIVQALVFIIGKLLTVIMFVLFHIARYNNFIGSPAVELGWVIARDFCNIIFVVIFLVMCIGTVLSIESYHYNRILTKLVIMAVLINFSKTICGIFIDISQVVMLTFMGAFGKLGGGFLTRVLGIDTLQDQARAGMSSGAEMDVFAQVGTYILVLAYIIIALAVVLVITIVLAQRLVMLWIYIVLSPFAYALSTFPAGSSYASKWWSEFTKYLTIGPIIAFFLWLSFASLGGVETSLKLEELEKQAGTASSTAQNVSAPQAGLTQAGSPSHIVKFIIGIAMLLGGLMVAQTMGGMAGKFAGSTMKNLQSGGVSFAKGTGHLGARMGLRAVGGLFDKGKNKIRESAGGDKGKLKHWKTGPSLATRWGKDMQSNYEKRTGGAWNKRLAKAGMGENAMESVYDNLGRLTSNKKAAVAGDILTFGALGGMKRGAKKGIENKLAAEKMAKAARANDDWFENLEEKEIFPSTGINSKLKHFLDIIKTDEKLAKKWASDIANKYGKKKKRKTAQLLASYASEAGGGKIEGHLTALNKANDIKYDKITPDQQLVNYRSAGQRALKDQRGDLSVGSSFAQGKNNTMAADFRDLEGAMKGAGVNFNVGAEGVHFENPQIIAQASGAISSLIDKKISSLDNMKASGDISDQAHKLRTENLQNAKKRLSDSGNLSDLELLNSGLQGGLANREGKMSHTHENLHKAGIQDEKITEDIAREIVESRMHSFTKDIGKEVARMEKQGENISFGKAVENVKNNYKSQMAGASGAVQESMQKKASKLEKLNSGSRAEKVVVYEKESKSDKTMEVSADMSKLANKLEELLDPRRVHKANTGIEDRLDQLTRTMEKMAHNLSSSNKEAAYNIKNENSSPLETKAIAEAVKESMANSRKKTA